ncbi:hypothetical protein OG481_31560 [Streptomyces longwoodensis]|uniref:hypothetical protein n=1 Tax=Streptomyces longwoodensis TaxID=68231 RepID=UPI002DDA0C9C|nr:hypothetical protein [Streptomyces longwoodensis]WRY92755.1 hypothetical protein OG481_31560 [Streptomyces longwoodensis]
MSIEAVTSLVTATVAVVGVPAVYLQARAARLSAEAAGRAQLHHARQTSQHAASVEVLAAADELKRACDHSDSAAWWLTTIYEDEASGDTGRRQRAAEQRESAERRHEEALDHAFEAYERLVKAVARLELEGPDQLIESAARLADLGDLLQLPGRTTGFDEDDLVYVTEREQQPFTWVVSQFGEARHTFIRHSRSYFNDI